MGTMNIFRLAMVALLYLFYHWGMIRCTDLFTRKKVPAWMLVATFLLNYAIFTIMSIFEFYLIANWSIFAVFLVVEIAVMYRCSFSVSLYFGLQAAMIGLACNLFARSVAAILMDMPLLVFDSYIHSAAMSNYRQYPISAGFLMGAMVFWWIRWRFRDFGNHTDEMGGLDLRFLLRLVMALFVYLDLNLLIYLTPTDDTIIKLWGLKSGACALIGYYIGLQNVDKLSRLLSFERRSRQVRSTLSAHEICEEELAEMVDTDCLTGCRSREYGMRELERAFRERRRFCLCFVDLNDLKTVNDSQGHGAGDRYLSAVSHVLSGVCGEGGIVCRYGGDEFLLMTGEDDFRQLRERMKNAEETLAQLSNSSEYPFRLSISYGVVCSCDYNTPEELVQAADEHMYRNKQEWKKNHPREKNIVAKSETNCD